MDRQPRCVFTMPDSLRVALVSLGCAKNLVDSEKMLGLLAEAGCAVTADEADADVIVINTCGFLEASRTEAHQVIREAIARKRDGTLRRVVVAGCLVQRDQGDILKCIDGVDALVGVNNRDDVVRAVLGNGTRGPGSVNLSVAAGGQAVDGAHRTTDLYLSDYHPFTQIDTARLRLTPRHYAYLRISEGCDQKCTFCTIPSIRGPMHGKPPRVVLDEARELVSDGAVEINLIGQDTTSYGLGEDRFDVGLAGLLRQLDAVDGLEWIRLMYVYPSVLTDEMLDAIADCERVCKYIDIPLQHIHDRVLKAMYRRIDRSGTERLLQRIRDHIPGVAIRTTMIVGFPGETDQEFEDLVRFIREFRFDALGAFVYSQEAKTPAGRMNNQVPDAVKRQRLHELMTAQQDVAFTLSDERVGAELEVLVDKRAKPNEVVARHRGQAPMVDSVTYVHDCDASPGEFVTVRCVGRDGYDLIAQPTRVEP